ncbi:MAG: sigma-54-dependent Fis family transcriptional regulator [Deltaproteobacteria bacterium]|nr:sigma-54-dependent Fis family transcriptional regulator [Deltaproteobacteria bacterium]
MSPVEATTDARATGARGSVLVIDDDADTAEVLCELLRRAGFATRCELNATDARVATDDVIEAVLTDLVMAPTDGLSLCAQISELRPDLPVVVMTGHASIDAAVGALRAGAFDFILKPVDPELLVLAADRAVAHHRLKSEVHRLRAEVLESRGFDLILGKSLAMRSLLDVVSRVAPTNATVLVTGESGTGKEVVARAIHARSSRSAGPFVAINCAAVPASLLESELFGHARGAFTDARTARRGLFLDAQGGTLFLDEIGEMPLQMQVKLLRALQERTVRAVGGSGESPFDARIIAATNRDLEVEVAAGRFREDLFYRIHVCAVPVPPLRDRDGDTLILARAFLARFAAKQEKAVRGISAPALAQIARYRWPGNVRELENCIERAVAMTQHDQLVLEDLPTRVREGHLEPLSALLPTAITDLVSMQVLEMRYMEHVIKVVNGNKTRAARILGYDRRTLYRKLDPKAQNPPQSFPPPESLDAVLAGTFVGPAST